MMIIVAILEDTGIFKWLSIRSFELSRGNVVRRSSSDVYYNYNINFVFIIHSIL